MTIDEIESKVNEIDTDETRELRESAKALLEMIRDRFPLGEVMPPDFKGSHSLTLSADGKLTANIWCDNLQWPVIFD